MTALYPHSALARELADHERRTMLYAFIVDVLENGGFVTDQQVRVLVEIDRLGLVLLRTTRGRMQVAAQDVDHYVSMIDRDPDDSLRDASIRTRDWSHVRDRLGATLLRNVRDHVVEDAADRAQWAAQAVRTWGLLVDAVRVIELAERAERAERAEQDDQGESS
jgi:hypothetical protein